MMAKSFEHTAKRILLNLLERLSNDPNADPKLIFDIGRELRRSEQRRTRKRKPGRPHVDDDAARRILGRQTE